MNDTVKGLPAYDRELIASMLTHAARQGSTPYSTVAIKEQIRLLEEADNAEAVGVQTVGASGEGLPEPDSLHERVEHYAVLVESFQRKMAAIGPMTPPESIAISGLIAAARDAVRLSIAPQGHGGGGEVVEFPEVLEEGETLYVRRDLSCGFSVDECRRLNALRFSSMRNGEHITSEDAVRYARAVLTEFTTPPTSTNGG